MISKTVLCECFKDGETIKCMIRGNNAQPLKFLDVSEVSDYLASQFDLPDGE